MYCGFATVSLPDMKDLLAAAESLQIKGISNNIRSNETEFMGPHPLPAASTDMPLAAARSTLRSSPPTLHTNITQHASLLDCGLYSYERNAGPRESLEEVKREETVGFNELRPTTDALGDDTASLSSPSLPQPLSSSPPPPPPLPASLVRGMGAVEPDRPLPKRMKKGIFALPFPRSSIPSTSVSRAETNISPERKPPAAWEDAVTKGEPPTIELSDTSDECGDLEAAEEVTPGSPRHSSRSSTATGSSSKQGGASELIHHSIGYGNKDPENLHQEGALCEGARLMDCAAPPTAADGMRILRRRSQKHRCSHCTNSFISLAQLRIRLRTHMGLRPFLCYRCPEAFAQSNNLSDHLRTHTGERPYQCTHCPKCFKTRKELTVHLRTHT